MTEYLKPVTTAMATIITATLSAVAMIASLMINEEKVPFCLIRYRRAMKKGRFNLINGHRYAPCKSKSFTNGRTQNVTATFFKAELKRK